MGLLSYSRKKEKQESEGFSRGAGYRRRKVDREV